MQLDKTKKIKNRKATRNCGNYVVGWNSFVSSKPMQNKKTNLKTTVIPQLNVE